MGFYPGAPTSFLFFSPRYHTFQDPRTFHAASSCYIIWGRYIYIQRIPAINKKNINNPIENGQEIWTSISQKKDIRVANKHMKRCSTSLVIRETQTKTIMSLPTKQLRWKILTVSIFGKDPEQQNLSYIMNANLNWYNYFGRKCLAASTKAEYVCSP